MSVWTEWTASLGAPLKSGLDGQVTMDQVVEEVAVAHEVLGDDLVSVELGNEYDHVTTLTPVQYLEKLKEYHAAIQARLRHAGRPVRAGLRHHVHGRGQPGIAQLITLIR